MSFAFFGAGRSLEHQVFQGGSGEFQSPIIGDRTGGAIAEGAFKLAVNQLNRRSSRVLVGQGHRPRWTDDDVRDVDLDGLGHRVENCPGNVVRIAE